jgi:hypothetical protein
MAVRPSRVGSDSKADRCGCRSQPLQPAAPIGDPINNRTGAPPEPALRTS